jgi:hypothetical protein
VNRHDAKDAKDAKLPEPDSKASLFGDRGVGRSSSSRESMVRSILIYDDRWLARRRSESVAREGVPRLEARHEFIPGTAMSFTVQR